MGRIWKQVPPPLTALPLSHPHCHQRQEEKAGTEAVTLGQVWQRPHPALIPQEIHTLLRSKCLYTSLLITSTFLQKECPPSLEDLIPHQPHLLNRGKTSFIILIVLMELKIQPSPGKTHLTPPGQPFSSAACRAQPGFNFPITELRMQKPEPERDPCQPPALFM